MIIPDVFAHAPAAVSVPRDVIRATGPDAEAFLQGQLSQDITPLAPGESAWSLILQPQGKVDSWLRVTRIDAQTFLLDVDAGAGDAALIRLNRFKLRTDCLFDSGTWTVLSIRGPGSLELEIPVDIGAEVVVPAAWPGVDGVDVLGPTVTPLAGVPLASMQDLELLRILCGVPAMGAELTEDTIPAEAGIVERSVSFTKGCFTGQELVARIDSRGGNVPRRLRGVVAAAPIAAKAVVLVDGVEAGTVTSASGEVGLAYIRRAIDTFPAAATIDGQPVELRELPLI